MPPVNRYTWPTMTGANVKGGTGGQQVQPQAPTGGAGYQRPSYAPVQPQAPRVSQGYPGQRWQGNQRVNQRPTDVPGAAERRQQAGQTMFGRQLSPGYQQRRAGRNQQRYGDADPHYDPSRSGYDPSNPVTQWSYDGKADLGANNGFNNANMWQQAYDQQLRAQGDQGEWDQRRHDSRSAADATRASYQAPAPYQAPNPYSYEQWQGQRPGIGTDEDLITSFNRYRALQDQSPSSGPVSSRDAQAGHSAGMGGAFYKYANAAANQLQTRMKDENRTLSDNAASRGRLNTGFFDEDKGNLWRQISGEAQDSINSRALDAAGLDQQAQNINANNTTNVNTANADRYLKAQQGNQDASRDDNQFLLKFAAGREDNRGQRADNAYEFDRNAYGDDRNFNYGVYGDQRDFGRRNYENDRDFGRGAYESDRDFDEKRYRFDEGGYDNANVRYNDEIASNRDWRYSQADRELANKGGGFLDKLGGFAGGIVGSAAGPFGAAAGKALGERAFGKH